MHHKQTHRSVHLGPTGSKGHAHSVRRASKERARRRRARRRKAARSSERAYGGALSRNGPNHATGSIPAHVWSASAPKRSFPAKRNTQTAVSAQAVQTRHGTTRSTWLRSGAAGRAPYRNRWRTWPGCRSISISRRSQRAAQAAVARRRAAAVCSRRGGLGSAQDRPVERHYIVKTDNAPCACHAAMERAEAVPRRI